MKHENIQVVVRQIADNALDKTNRQEVRVNYAQSLRNIRDYCDAIIKKYEGLK